MANADIPNGLVPYGPCLRVRPYRAGGTVYKGDPLKFDANGEVVVCAATNPSLGVALNYAVNDGEVLVADHPDQEFVIQASAADIDNQDDINQNFDMVFGSANTTYRRSGVELDSTTGGTTAALVLKLLRILPAVDNALGANVKCIVKINNHQLGSHTGTAGV